MAELQHLKQVLPEVLAKLTMTYLIESLDDYLKRIRQDQIEEAEKYFYPIIDNQIWICDRCKKEFKDYAVKHYTGDDYQFFRGPIDRYTKNCNSIFCTECAPILQCVVNRYEWCLHYCICEVCKSKTCQHDGRIKEYIKGVITCSTCVRAER